MSSSIKFRAQSIFREVGDFGRFQMLHLSLLALPITIYAAISISYVFTASDLIYRCKIKGCDDTDVYNSGWVKDAFPLEPNNDHQFQKCVRYKAKSPQSLGHCRTSDLFDKTTTEECGSDGFVYNSREITIVNKFNLHCKSSKYKLPLVASINNLGLVVFLPIAGILSDGYGRRKTFVWSLFLVGIIGLLKAFANHYWLFLMLEFLEAGVGSAALSAAFVLGIEMVGKSGRAFAASALTFFDAVGHISLGYLAFYLQNYQYLLMCLHIPAIFVLSYLWLVPESIQWLLIKRFNAAVVDQIQVTARNNGQTLSERTKESIEKVRSFARRLSRSVSQTPKEGSMFRSSRLVIRLIVCGICWLAIVFIDLSLTLHSVYMIRVDKYDNFIDVVLTEIPANILSFLSLSYFSRKWPISVFALSGAVFCLANMWLTIEYERWLVVAAKFCASIAFGNLHVFTVELFPTDGRNTVICLCSMVSRIGVIFAPYMIIDGLGDISTLILTGCGIVCALMVWCLPETGTSKMPENVQDAEDIGRNYDPNANIEIGEEPKIILQTIDECSTVDE